VTQRRVDLVGPVNFRDVGGYAARDGSIVKQGRVYRSDSLHHLGAEDGPRLSAIGIRTAIDFRADDELDRIGIGRLGDLDIRHLHLPTVDKAMHTVRPPNWEAPESAAAVYLIMMRTGGAAYAEALRTLAAAETLPAVFFCMAGKDRTGVFGAVLLGLLGVSEEDIVADYALTHEVVDVIHERGKAESPDRVDIWAELPDDLLGAHAASMEGMLAGIPEIWGDFDGYAASIGVTPDVVDTLRATLLETP
jgi:protein-tyrosine phosphatase